MVLRRVRRALVGSLVLVALAGCGRGLYQFAQREPWRAEAEAACMKSGAVKEKPGRVRVEAIEGPGICGANYPMKIAALGEGDVAMGFAQEQPLRPPGAVGSPQLRWPVAAPAQPSRHVSAGEPVSLEAPPGLAPPQTFYTPDHRGLMRDEVEPPRLGPSRGPLVTGSVAVEVKPQATLACPMVSALDRWVTDAVQPAAMKWFGQPVVELRQISAYSCRGMNGQVGARISEHAFGNALDIAAFVLADGRRVIVKNHWLGSPEEQAFFRDLQAAACDTFMTVLAPGSNRFHYDHFHFDLMRRASGRRVCNPDAVDGDQLAARLRGQGTYAARLGGSRPGYGRAADPYAARRADAMPTGSLGKRKKGKVEDDDDWVEDDGPRTSIEDILREPVRKRR